MGTCRLERRGSVSVLVLCDGENRFDPETVAAIQGALDEVEATPGPGALVTTGEGNFFSNGLALEWMLRGRRRAIPGAPTATSRPSTPCWRGSSRSRCRPWRP